MKINPNALSINSPWKSLAARRQHAPAANQTTANQLGGAQATGKAPVLGGPSQSIPSNVDLQQFFAAWGTSDANFDMTKNGVVDGEDLAIFLSNSQPAPASPTTVLEQWGSATNQAGGGDVNGDGNVDGADLALALGNVKPSAQDQLIAGVQKAWGSSETSYDFNKDGTVDGTDLGMVLSGEVTSPIEAADPAAIATKITDAVFAAQDIDQDAEIVADELPASGAKLAAKLDADRDGVIGRDELRDRIAQELSQIKERSPNANVSAIAQRWLGHFLGTVDPRVNLARQGYLGQSMGTAAQAVNARA
jgi:hypothetical protein